MKTMYVKYLQSFIPKILSSVQQRHFTCYKYAYLWLVEVQSNTKIRGHCFLYLFGYFSYDTCKDCSKHVKMQDLKTEGQQTAQTNVGLR